MIRDCVALCSLGMLALGLAFVYWPLSLIVPSCVLLGVIGLGLVRGK